MPKCRTDAAFHRWSTEFIDDRAKCYPLQTKIYQRFLHFANELCESPIEQRLLAGLLFCPFGYFDPPHIICTFEDIPRFLAADNDVFIIPQASFKNLPYRADFLIAIHSDGDWVQFVVECDGHDFHDRTKEQAARDRRRDQRFQQSGMPVIRFTGSEIFRDLEECVDQLDDFGSCLVERSLPGYGRTTK